MYTVLCRCCWFKVELVSVCHLRFSVLASRHLRGRIKDFPLVELSFHPTPPPISYLSLSLSFTTHLWASLLLESSLCSRVQDPTSLSHQLSAFCTERPISMLIPCPTSFDWPYSLHCQKAPWILEGSFSVLLFQVSTGYCHVDQMSPSGLFFLLPLPIPQTFKGCFLFLREGPVCLLKR